MNPPYEAIFFLSMFSSFLVAVSIMQKKVAKELAKQLEEVDFSVPLRVRDFLAWKGWLKLAYRWGVWKTVGIYSLIVMTILAGISYVILSVCSIMNLSVYSIIKWYVGYTISATIVILTLFYRQISKALKDIKKNA